MNRIISIDLLKFIATLLIFNHLAQPYYGKYSMLATGGGMGCALFYFISGYLCQQGRKDRFDLWMKRKLSRLWANLHGCGVCWRIFRSQMLCCLCPFWERLVCDVAACLLCAVLCRREDIPTISWRYFNRIFGVDLLGLRIGILVSGCELRRMAVWGNQPKIHLLLRVLYAWRMGITAKGLT